MITDERIQLICSKAITLPECPVKKEHAIAQRAWLFNKIKELLNSQQQSEGYKPQMELK
jgi:hypothetical protein